MSIVAVHGPNMWGGTGAGGGGTGPVVTAGPVQATADQSNGWKFTFQVVPPSTRSPIGDLVWTFPGATVVPASPLTGNGPFVATYSSSGSKTATLTVSGAGTPAVPANGSYPITVTATGTAAGQPRMVQPPPDEGESDFDPGDHTIAEVEEYVNANPDQAQAVYDLEVEGKQRVTLITWLEEFEA